MTKIHQEGVIQGKVSAAQEARIKFPHVFTTFRWHPSMCEADHAPGLAAALVNFARLVQFLENQLDSDLWSTSDAENEQGGTSDAESEPSPVPATPVAQVKHSCEGTPPKKARRS